MDRFLVIIGIFIVAIVVFVIATFSRFNTLNNRLNSVDQYFEDGNLVGIKSIKTYGGWTIQDNGGYQLQIALDASKNDSRGCGIAPAVDNPVLWFFKNDGTLYGPTCGHDSTPVQANPLQLLTDRKCNAGQNC